MNSEGEKEYSEEIKKLVQDSAGTQENFELILKKELKDCFLIKLYVDLSGKNGFLFFIISENTKKLLSMYSIVGVSPSLRRINPFESFPGLIEDLDKTIKSGGIEETLSERIGRSVFRNCTDTRLEYLIPQIQSKQTKEFLSFIEESIKEETKLKSIRMTVDIEKINVLEYLEKNFLRTYYPQVRNPFIQDEPQKLEADEIGMESVIEKFNTSLAEVFTKYREVVRCSVGISPLNGIELYKLKEGQPIYFTLPGVSAEDREIARAHEAIDEMGKIKPIIGRFLKLMISPKGEHNILAVSNIDSLLHAVENNQVKVSVPKEEDILEKKGNKVGFFFLVFLTLLLAIGMFLIIIFR